MIKRISLLLVMVLLLCTAAPVLAESPAVHVTSVSLNTETMAFLPDSPARQLTAAVEPANATDARVYWMSSNESVATVDENGLVTGVKPGEATITVTCARDKKVVGTFTVTVVAAASMDMPAEESPEYEALPEAVEATAEETVEETDEVNEP